MKKNLPVTDIEVEVPVRSTIVSKTDLRGRITYANDAFVSVSGFSQEELIGKNHNLVRHPDMPPAAFEQLWKTIRAGNPWSGVVKNRTKDGNFYWVEATVVPIRKEDQVIGYMSVRQRASREKIEAAESLYKTLWEGKQKLRLPNIRSFLSIRSGFVAGGAFVIALMVIGGALGLTGLGKSNATIEGIQNGYLGAMSDVSSIDRALLDFRAAIPEYTGEESSKKEVLTKVQAARDAIRKGLSNLKNNSYLRSDLTRQVNLLESDVQQLSDRVIVPIEFSLEGNRLGRVMIPKSVDQNNLYMAVVRDVALLRESVIENANLDMQQTITTNNQIRHVALIGLLFGIVVVGLASHLFFRGIVLPLEEAIKNFDRISQGDLTGEVSIYERGETGQLLRSSAIMQLHLKVIMDEIALTAHSMFNHIAGLNVSLFSLANLSDDQQETIHRAMESLRQVSHDADRTSQDADQALSGLTSLKSISESHALADFEEIARRVAAGMRLQMYSVADSIEKLGDISSQIVDARQGTQDAYMASEKLKSLADSLMSLVSYFETSSYEQDDDQSDEFDPSEFLKA